MFLLALQCRLTDDHLVITGNIRSITIHFSYAHTRNDHRRAARPPAPPRPVGGTTAHNAIAGRAPQASRLQRLGTLRVPGGPGRSPARPGGGLLSLAPTELPLPLSDCQRCGSRSRAPSSSCRRHRSKAGRLGCATRQEEKESVGSGGSGGGLGCPYERFQVRASDLRGGVRPLRGLGGWAERSGAQALSYARPVKAVVDLLQLQPQLLDQHTIIL